MAKVVFDSEKELENMIVSSMKFHAHCPITGDVVDHVFQQLPLGAYGITDIVTMNYEAIPGDPPKIHYRIIEVKKDSIKTDSVAQLSRYITGLRQILSETKIGHEWDVSGILVAPDIDMSGDTCFMCEQAEDIHVFIAFCDLETGLRFTSSSGWKYSEVAPQEVTLKAISKVDSEVRELMLQHTTEMEAANG
jgi:hypothetical protein